MKISNQIKTLVQKGWDNKWIKNLMIFIIVFVPIIAIDQGTKAGIFDGDKSGHPSETVADWKIIAFRSQFHTSTTFLDFIGGSLPLWAALLIDYTLVFAFASIIIFSKTKLTTVAASFAFAGILGNTIDASAFHGVRNVFFIPWRDNGTFNFADIIIVIGSIGTGLSFIVPMLLKDFKKK